MMGCFFCSNQKLDDCPSILLLLLGYLWVFKSKVIYVIYSTCTKKYMIWSLNMFVTVQLLSRVWLFATPWTAAQQAPLSFTICQSLLKFMSIELVMVYNHLSSAAFFSFCLQSFPALRSFPMSQLFTWGGQNIGALASVLSMNIQGIFSFRIDRFDLLAV